MTELALILGIQGVALAYVLWVGRGILLADPSTQRLRRLEGALHRATTGFLGQQARVVSFGCLGAGLGLCALHATWSGGAAALGGFRAALVAALSVLFGAGLALACAYVALRLNLRASARVASSAAAGLDHSLRLAVRAGGAAALTCESASLCGFVAAFGTVFALAGGTVLPPAEALALARDIVALLSGIPLGGALATLVLSRGGGTYHVAATLGADLAAARDPGLSPDDARNPALVSSVAGYHLTEGVSRAALFFSMSSASHVAVLALGLAAVQRDASPTLALALLPFVARSFFLLATTFAFSAVRAEELSNPSAAVVRGHVSATVIGSCGVLGTCFWLQREHLGHLFAASLVASATAVIVALPVWAQLLRRNTVLREAGDTLRGNGLSTALSSFSGGLEAALLPTVVLGIGAAVVWKLGAATGLPSGGLWASLLGWAALLGAAPFAFTVSSVAALANAAHGTATLAAFDADAQRRAERLDETHVAAASARAQLIAGCVGSALLCVLAIPVLGRAEAGLNLAILEPAVTWSGALGVALVLAYTGSCTRAGVRGAREIASEVERQLRGFPREQGQIKFPRDFAPTYKLCVDLSARSALRELWLYAFGALALQALVALALSLSFRGSAEPVALRGLTSFVLFTALTGFTAACAIDTARATLAFVRRLARTQLASDPKPLSATAGVSGLLGSAAGPALQALIIATASVGLSLAPFLKS